MSVYYVTYLKNGKPYKAALNEDRYNQLKSDGAISDLVVYTSELLMEKNYNSLCSNQGNAGNKGFIFG